MTQTIGTSITPPAPRKHGFLSARASMRAEIDELRQFINHLLEDVVPDGYEQLVREMAAMESARDDAAGERRAVEAELGELLEEKTRLKQGIVDLHDEAILQEVGVYEYRHAMENADEYKEALSELRREVKACVKDDRAVRSDSGGWTVNGSEREGQKMVRNMSKLLLRAYNNEADVLIDKLRPFRLDAAVERLTKSQAAINRLGAQPMAISITDHYHDLRVEELELAADWLAKKEEEKEEAKAERSRLREEAKARKEIEAERARLAKEQAHYLAVVEKLRADHGSEQQTAEMEAKLAEIEDALSTVEQRSANTRAGHVYVISNIGSFGDQIVKIGLTRRLDPMDRIRELGDASVPFPYDLHALVFSDDAVALEQSLHDQFAEQRVNLANLRREFFYVNPAEVKRALIDSGLLAVVTEFVEEPEAEQWHVSENTRRVRT